VHDEFHLSFDYQDDKREFIMRVGAFIRRQSVCSSPWLPG
jgi:hypothetical protein